MRARRRFTAAAAVPLLLAAIACAEDKKENEEEEALKARTASCDGKLGAADAAAALPAELPAGVTGAVFYETSKQGSTTLYFAHVEGDDVVKTRDTIRTAFEGAGYEIEGSDEEEQAEAEFEFVKGGKEGSVQVLPLCEGHQRVRWRIGSE
jgi:hypothetical protein